MQITTKVLTALGVSDANAAKHIDALNPEHPDCTARRDAAGDVLRPAESTAGGKNRRCAVPRTAWWLGSRYSAYAFWRHPLG